MQDTFDIAERLMELEQTDPAAIIGDLLIAHPELAVEVRQMLALV